MSFFAKFYKTGTTAIAQQDIKVKTVKVPNTATAPHTLPMVGHQRPAPSRSPSSTNLTQNTTTSTTASTSISTIKAKSTKSKRTNLVSPPLPGCERSRDSKNAQGRSAERGDISSVKRKGSSSSFTRLDNRTSSLRSVSSSTELATSHSKKRCLTPSAPHHRTSPIQEKLVSSDEESDSPSDYDARAGSTEERLLKLQKAQELGLTTRVYLNPKSFRPDRMSFVHADQIANMDKEGYRRAFPASTNVLEVFLSYPAMPLFERYHLVQNRDSDEFDPLEDIIATIELVANHLLSAKQRTPITTDDPSEDGILRLIRRSIKRNEPENLLTTLEKYNSLIRTYRKSGVFKRNIERLCNSSVGIPLALSERILTQSYARSVALEVDSLRKYKAFSNNVYGELLPRFTSELFKQARLRPDQVFVDLGSGTGSVVLHAALEVGCESWGCEMMEKACELADAQAREFEARCILWGLNPGKVTLEKGDFLENDAIAGVLLRADVLLVNNYAFDSTLNERLMDMFLDLKEGAQIISLKPFAPPNHVITRRNLNSPANLLRVEQREYFSGCVSWTDAPGRYYVAIVDRSMLRAFLAENGQRKGL